MKKTIYIISGLLITAGILFACAEKFIDTEPQNSLNINSLGSEKGVEAVLVGAYSMLDGYAKGIDGPAYPKSTSNWILGSVASDDAYKGSQSGDQPESSVIELYQWQPTTIYVNEKFKSVYESIRRANSAIALAKSTLESGGISQEKADEFIQQARFLRGFYHFEGYKIWGNIPYYSEEANDGKIPNDPTGSTANLVAKMLEDFQEAEKLDPTPSGGKITGLVATAMVGKLMMYEKNYAEAKAAFDKVVNSKQYALQDDYHSTFSVPGENGADGKRGSLLAYQASVNDGAPEGENASNADRLNFPHSGSPFGCCGFHQPSQNLVNAFKTDTNGLPYLDTFNDVDLDPSSDTVDPRLDWTVGRDDVPYLNFGLHASGWIRDRSYAGPYSPKKLTYHKGEGEHSTVGWTPTGLSAVNIQLLRYADVILMLAEAEVELGNLERARELVNMVRARAANTYQGVGPADAASNDMPGLENVSSKLVDGEATESYAKYKIKQYEGSWTDANTARKAVRMERRLELGMEGHRLFDLRRWGTAPEVLNAYLEKEKTRRAYLGNAFKFEEKHMRYPLPQLQITASETDGKPAITQNEGW